MTPAPVAPRTATSVILLRESEGRLRTWIIERVPEMAFAAGMTVFPGGKVEPTDAAITLSSAELDRLATTLALPSGEAGALAVAALRETFEETGVLLTDAPPAVEDGERRAAVEEGTESFAAVIGDAGLVLDTSALIPWSRWITPAGAPRRFDTWFFVVVLGARHHPADVSTEATVARWADVDDLVAEFREKRRPMLPPTAAILSELQRLGSLDAVVAAGGSRNLAPVEPVIVTGPDGEPTISLPSHVVI